MTGFKDNGDGTVSITMTRDDFDELSFGIGIVAGSQHGEWQIAWLALANRMNAGNPDFAQYPVSEET